MHISDECHQPGLKLDSVMDAMIALFSISTVDNWTSDLTHILIYADGVPSPISYFFMISFIMIMTFIMVNVFVGFIVVAFLTEREKQEGFSILNKHAQDCINMALKIKIEREEHGSKYQMQVRKYLDTAAFEYTMIICVILNCIVLMTKHYRQSETFTSIQRAANFLFTGIFTVESMLKLFATSLRKFVRDPWSMFDALLVVGSWIDILLMLLKIDINFDLNIFRMIRAVRILRIISQNGNLKQILATFVKSLRSVPRIGFLVILVLYIYAVVGRQVSFRISHSTKRFTIYTFLHYIQTT